MPGRSGRSGGGNDRTPIAAATPEKKSVSANRGSPFPTRRSGIAGTSSRLHSSSTSETAADLSVVVYAAHAAISRRPHDRHNPHRVHRMLHLALWEPEIPPNT